MTPGLHQGIPMADYLALDALSSSRLADLAISPLHYRYMLGREREDTEATDRGTALHVALLEPERFARLYAPEPDVEQIGGAKPRATKEYKQACAEIEDAGRTVIRRDELRKVHDMRDAILGYELAARLLERAPMREVTMVWERDGRLCRGRADMLGDLVVGEVKTTRSLKHFSPWHVTRLGYYRRGAWYLDGLRRLGRKIDHMMFIAVESSPPHDVGVFELDDAAREFGWMEIDGLMDRLAYCEAMDEWPGMFAAVQKATVTDAFASEMVAETEGVA